MWNEISTVYTKCSRSGFSDALLIWMKKPHVVNRLLCGTKVLKCKTLTCRKNAFNFYDHLVETAQNAYSIEALLDECCNAQSADEGATFHVGVVVRDLLPKQLDRFNALHEIVILADGEYAIFKPLESVRPGESDLDWNRHPAYCIQYNEEAKCITLLTDTKEDFQICASDKSLACKTCWLKDTLLPKIARWAEERVLNTEPTSLKMVDVERYNQVYQELKQKYGQKLLAMWTERTDPQKYIFEDIGIASYLIVVWEAERANTKQENKQSFVDLGCGNGLLVYILCSEGYTGLGIDVRKRNIWNQYGSEIPLQERSITPSESSLFPEYDWIIGNHSDELTPWIPVIASRSSFQCKYFLLPCCPWDFNGKFNQKASVSNYRGYLNYIKEVGEMCGFVVEEDALRIPSTKKVCFMGKSRSYQFENDVEIDKERQGFIDKRCGMNKERKWRHGMKSSDSDDCNNEQKDSDPAWAADFRPRSAEEKSRNCTTVSVQLRNTIIYKVFDHLLNDADASCTLGSEKIWNSGGCVTLQSLVKMFDKETLLQLKSECGGLQTLLRNAHHVFQVSGGQVRLRDWTSTEHEKHQTAKKKRKGVKEMIAPSQVFKTKLCYFYQYHPDGCPIPAVECRFAHGETELRTFSL